MSIFRSAITDGSGNVDSGYLSMFWVLVGWSVNNVIILFIAAIAAYHIPISAPKILQNMGIALGANAGGFATVIGAVGMFRMGDKPHPGTITASSQSSSITASPLPEQK